MDHVINKLYIGCFESAENKDLLVKNNIKYIFNVAIECNNSVIISQDLNIFVHKYNIYDDRDITMNILKDIYNKIDNIHSLDGNILVHCAHGRSRSSCVVLYYLMIKCNYTLSDAIEFLKIIRPCIIPSLNYIKLLSTNDNKFNIDFYYLKNIRNIISTNLNDSDIMKIVHYNNYDVNSIISNLI
jgi:protein-tyrosine phosphatase